MQPKSDRVCVTDIQLQSMRGTPLGYIRYTACHMDLERLDVGKCAPIVELCQLVC